MDKDVERLARLPLFRTVNRKDLARLVSSASAKTLAKGERVFSLDQPSDGTALLLVSGRLDVFVGEGPTRRRVSDIGPGELVGEVGLFTRGQPRTADVIASKASRGLVVDREVLDGSADNPALVALEQHLLGSLARRIRRTTLALQRGWRREEETLSASRAPRSSTDSTERKARGLRARLSSLLGGR